MCSAFKLRKKETARRLSILKYWLFNTGILYLIGFLRGGVIPLIFPNVPLRWTPIFPNGILRLPQEHPLPLNIPPLRTLQLFHGLWKQSPYTCVGSHSLPETKKKDPFFIAQVGWLEPPRIVVSSIISNPIFFEGCGKKKPWKKRQVVTLELWRNSNHLKSFAGLKWSLWRFFFSGAKRESWIPCITLGPEAIVRKKWNWPHFNGQKNKWLTEVVNGLVNRQLRFFILPATFLAGRLRTPRFFVAGWFPNRISMG